MSVSNEAFQIVKDKLTATQRAANLVCDEIEATELHGAGAHDESCSVCRAIAALRKLTK